MRLSHEIIEKKVLAPTEIGLNLKVSKFELLVTVHDITLEYKASDGKNVRQFVEKGATYNFGMFGSYAQAEEVILKNGVYKPEIVQLFQDEIDAQAKHLETGILDARNGSVARFIQDLHK